MSRLLYVSQSYVPSRRADAVQVVNMCEALAAAGRQVELLTKKTPSRFEPGVSDDFGFYGVAATFEIRKLPRPKLKGGGLLFALAVSRALERKPRPDLVYSRYLWGARRAIELGLPTVYEAHGVPAGRGARRRFQELVESPHLKRLVVITEALLRDLATGFTLDPDLVTVAPDAVARRFVDRFTPAPRPQALRRVGYVGQLYPGRGIPILVELARRMPELDFEIVGGHDGQIAAWRRQAPPDNLRFRGFVAPSELATVYAGLDALLMPHERRVGAQSGRSDIADWTSPMKMFEYMATGRPIVASDLPVLGEVLEHERNALIAEAENLDAWQAALSRLAGDSELAMRLGRNARQDVLDRYTWDARAQEILGALDR